MELFINISVGITGISLIASVMVIETKNFRSALIFKVFPFFLGLSCLFSSAKLFGFI